MKESIIKPTYYPSFDLLKFFCAILIVLHHYQMVFGFWLEGRLNFNNGYFYFGLMVELFFIISGILSENSFYRSPLSSFTSFFSKKYMRFFPMCFITVTIYTLLQWIGVSLNGAFFLEQPVSIWYYITSSLLISTGWGTTELGTLANSPIWYINILLICYICHFFIKKIASHFNVSVIPFYIFMIILGINLHPCELKIAFLNYDCATGYITYFIGCLLFQLVSRYKNFMRNISVIVSLIILLLIIFFFNSPLWSVFRGSQQYFMIFAIYPWFVTLLMTISPINKLCDNHIIKFLGNCSFEMYLWHFPLLSLLSIIITKFNIFINFGYKSMLIFVISTFIFSAIIVKIVEKPLHNFVNSFMNN